MSWSYSGNPSDSVLDEVRFWCQDTDEQRQLLSDEEVSYLIDKWYPSTGSAIFVASMACEVVSGKLAAEVSISADGVSAQIGELQQRYVNLAARLRDQHKEEIEGSMDLDGDRIWSTIKDASIAPLVFGVGFTDNYEAGRSDYGAYSPGDRGNSYVYNPLVAEEAEEA